MKKSYSNFLLTSLKVGMPMLAAACFAVTDSVAAAEDAKASSAIQKEVAARSQEFKEILEALAEVENMAKVEDDQQIDFKTVYAKLKDIDAKLNAKKVSLKGEREALKYYEGLVARFNATRSAFGVLAAEEKFQKAKSLYEEAAKAGVSASSAEKALEAKGVADEARYIYYVNPLDQNGARDPELLDKAINATNQDFSVRVTKLIAACDKIAKAYEFRIQTDTAAVDPNYANRMDKINKLYAQANNLYRKAQYTQARDLCEQIFIDDPCNAKAVALLDKIYKKLYFYSELRAYNELLRSDAETIWLWSNAIPASNNRVVQEQKREVKDPLMEKLDAWKISVSFVDYSISDAIIMIREKSREVDPRRMGINFLERGIAGTETANTSITLELDNVPISVVLNYLCKKAGISWKTQEAFVLYGHGISDYETTEIPMRNSVYHTITSANEEGEDGDGEDKDEGGWGVQDIDSVEKTISSAGGKKRAVVSDKKLKAFFEERGIPFDEQSKVIYNPKTHRLAVTNTRENLQKLELLVREIDVETPLVLIESKILEISVNDEEELGFDWTATYTNDKNSAYNFSMGSPLRAVAPSAVNTVEGIVNDKLINNLNIIPNMNLNGGHQLNFYLTVSAVDRTDRLEQLSTPKVVVKNGDTAVIKMVRSMYFPDSWESPDTEIDDGDVAMETSYPEFGDPDEVGIQFTVTPTVSSNKYTIQLDLEPSITDLTGWTDYSYDMVIRRNPFDEDDIDTENPEEAQTVTAAAVSTDLFRVNIKMPEISRRELITKLKCFDAQTMMVGGMVIDKQVSMEDRYPILGDLPLIGRFFTKTSDTSARSNLLISVSPRLISGDGVPINSRPNNGVPDFRFRK